MSSASSSVRAMAGKTSLQSMRSQEWPRLNPQNPDDERKLDTTIDGRAYSLWVANAAQPDSRPVWLPSEDPTTPSFPTFSKNRERLLGADVAAKFLAAVLRHPKVTRFLSDEHFSVDGTLVDVCYPLPQAPDAPFKMPQISRSRISAHLGEV